jgi:hypothetical protein
MMHAAFGSGNHKSAWLQPSQSSGSNVMSQAFVSGTPATPSPTIVTRCAPPLPVCFEGDRKLLPAERRGGLQYPRYSP